MLVKVLGHENSVHKLRPHTQGSNTLLLACGHRKPGYKGSLKLPAQVVCRACAGDAYVETRGRKRQDFDAVLHSGAAAGDGW